VSTNPQLCAFPRCAEPSDPGYGTRLCLGHAIQANRMLDAAKLTAWEARVAAVAKWLEVVRQEPQRRGA
jgi:hypothetical protein